MGSRQDRLMPGGIPRYIRVYDLGESVVDRYTVVYTGRYDPGSYMYVGMNSCPFHPSYGVCQHGQGENGPIDRPSYKHLGKRIQFQDLPEDCKEVVKQDYMVLWGLMESIDHYAY